MLLPRRLSLRTQSSEERARWSVVRLDSGESLPGEVIEADADTGTVRMRERGPDMIAQDGSRTLTWVEVDYRLHGGLAIVRR